MLFISSTAFSFNFGICEAKLTLTKHEEGNSLPILKHNLELVKVAASMELGTGAL